MPLNAAKIYEIKNDAQILTPMKATVETVLEGVVANHKAANVADMAGTEDLPTTQGVINDILAALQAAGLMAAS